MITTTEDLLDPGKLQDPADIFPDQERRDLFTTLIGLVQTNCSEESGWDGTTKHLPFVTGLMSSLSVKAVLQAVKTRCAWIDIAVHEVLLGQGCWLLGVSSTESGVTFA